MKVKLLQCIVVGFILAVLGGVLTKTSDSQEGTYEIQSGIHFSFPMKEYKDQTGSGIAPRIIKPSKIYAWSRE